MKKSPTKAIAQTPVLPPVQQGLEFNWSKIKKLYKGDKGGLELFVAASKNQIAKYLMLETRKRGMVQDLVRKCASQSCFNQVIRGKDDIIGELDEVIANTTQRWEKYCREIVGNNKKMAHATKEGALRLDNDQDIMGYYRNSAKNAFADLFIHHHAQKRAASEVNFSSLLSNNDEDNERTYEEGIVCTKTSKISFNQNKLAMINTLRNYDKKSGKKTKLARVFVAMMNPRYNGAVTVIQNRLKLNNKSFNEAKEGIVFLLRENFGDIKKEVIDFLDNSQGAFSDLEQGNRKSRQYKSRKEQKQIENNTAKPCRLNEVYGQKAHPTNNKKVIYYALVQVQRSKTAKPVPFTLDAWDTIYNKEERVEGKPDQLKKYKEMFQKKMKKAVEEASKIANSNGNFEVKTQEVDLAQLAA
jgi:hypothetical protein